MKALVADQHAPGRVAIRDVPIATAQRDEVVVEVHAVSLNRGELRMLRSAPTGFRPGWDFSGILRDDVDDQIRAGSRVVGIVEGGSWAQQVAVRRDWLAAIPNSVPFERAAVVPTAGLTAMRTLRRAGVSVGDRVLITAAAGGVGRFAVQLAALAGATVTTLVTSRSDADALRPWAPTGR